MEIAYLFNSQPHFHTRSPLKFCLFFTVQKLFNYDDFAGNSASGGGELGFPRNPKLLNEISY